MSIYEALNLFGIKKNDSKVNLKKIYYKLMMENHPDLHNDDLKYIEVSKKINEAYELLCNSLDFLKKSNIYFCFDKINAITFNSIGFSSCLGVGNYLMRFTFGYEKNHKLYYAMCFSFTQNLYDDLFNRYNFSVSDLELEKLYIENMVNVELGLEIFLIKFDEKLFSFENELDKISEVKKDIFSKKPYLGTVFGGLFDNIYSVFYKFESDRIKRDILFGRNYEFEYFDFFSDMFNNNEKFFSDFYFLSLKYEDSISKEIYNELYIRLLRYDICDVFNINDYENMAEKLNFCGNYKNGVTASLLVSNFRPINLKEEIDLRLNSLIDDFLFFCSGKILSESECNDFYIKYDCLLQNYYNKCISDKFDYIGNKGYHFLKKKFPFECEFNNLHNDKLKIDNNLLKMEDFILKEILILSNKIKKDICNDLVIDVSKENLLFFEEINKKFMFEYLKDYDFNILDVGKNENYIKYINEVHILFADVRKLFLVNGDLSEIDLSLFLECNYEFFLNYKIDLDNLIKEKCIKLSKKR